MRKIQVGGILQGYDMMLVEMGKLITISRGSINDTGNSVSFPIV
jgi:hypothetical protein